MRFFKLIFLMICFQCAYAPLYARASSCISYTTCLTEAETGDAYAQFFIGYSYHYGKAVTPDFNRASHWYALAANQGLISAQINGLHVCKMIDEIGTWLPLAEKGNAFAQNCLGHLYHNGYGMPADQNVAFDWYLKAAEQDYADAQYSLAHMYYNGLGHSQDRELALSWMRKAADKSHISAIEDLIKFDTAENK